MRQLKSMRTSKRVYKGSDTFVYSDLCVHHQHSRSLGEQPKINSMKVLSTFLVVSTLLCSCGAEKQKDAVKKTPGSIVGTWRLLSGTLIEKGDTTVTDYTKNQSFIKIINDSHFAFLKHGLNKDSAANYDSGGGSYSLMDSTYTEHLEYCNEREWEGHDFSFTISLKGDTLTQSGIEKVEKAGINRLNIERYVRQK